ncbi:hypothetical protein [Pseudoxanthomonas sp. PXM04]|uniref:hypothetical protein n=1 Tax=Pseudoxanthomonas sp. PXM04 TaxID=2769297 RepID=UPI0017811F49|nr:hypothetical protein [Pseudoxanthomonas sp. PXM04]MBD9376179.1 hypothetical protein [Pseudoxanthomonas sp. PXM04]
MYEFEGQRFASLGAFQRAFPAYGRHTAWLKEGVTTIMEMEKRIAAANAVARAKSLAGSRSTPAYTFSRKAFPRRRGHG